MLELSKEEDTNEENAQHDGTLSMPKRELFDKLPSILTIDVATTSMVVSVNVLPSWRFPGVLQIEITQPNLDLLLEEPPAEPAPWTPTIEADNHVYSVLKFSSDIASVLVGFTSDMDDDAKRDAVKSAIAEFQEFEYGPHTLENIMPWQQQDSEASDGATDPFAAYRAYEPTQ